MVEAQSAGSPAWSFASPPSFFDAFDLYEPLASGGGYIGMEPVSKGAEAREREHVPRACRTWREALDEGESPAGLSEHLGQCSGCRKYAEALQFLGADLLRMSQSAVEPSAELHARWTAAVRNHTKGPAFAEVLAEWLERLRYAFVGNLKPIRILTPIWLLMLFFRFTTPHVTSGSATPGHSPVAIVRLLKIEQQQMQAFAMGVAPGEIKQHDGPAPRPRSQLGIPTPARQAFTEQKPDTLLACVDPKLFNHVCI